MSNLVGSRTTHGLSRRSFLSVGMLAPLGISLADLLRAEAAAGVGSSRKAVVNIHLDGGPPHMDMIDLKPQAPAEIRGEFRPIATTLRGLEVGELLPKLATIAERFTFIRSLTESAGGRLGLAGSSQAVNVASDSNINNSNTLRIVPSFACE